MLFPTYQFLIFFLLVFCGAIYFKPKVFKYKIFLISTSIIFYSLWGLNFLSLLVADTLINYSLIKLVFYYKQHKKSILIFTLIFNLAYLGIFKYYKFFTDSLFHVVYTLNIPASFPVIEILMPVGISFYTFRIISHFLDCYNQNLPCPNLIDYTAYITYFPQIASGPIARAKEFYQQLNHANKYDYQIAEVISLILSGLFKKYTLSSFLFNFTQLPFRTPQQYSSTDLILASIAYYCLIYVDFSGYSDLANAISSLLGFKPIQNFNMPYRSLSLQEFWKRWHISLSQWLRDYLYIPLGGNRQGKIRKYFNLFLTMLIGGFWHGAGLNFLIWGGIHGSGLIINHIWNEYGKKSLKITSLPPVLSWFITFIFLNVSWVFFNSVSAASAWEFIRGIFSSGVSTRQFNHWQLYVCFALVFLMNFYGDKIQIFFRKMLDRLNIILQIILISVCTYIILMLGPSVVPPFIYFNF